MTMSLKRQRIIARHDVVITRFTYDDGSFQLRVTGPHYKSLDGQNIASPDDTMEFLINGLAFMIGVIRKYRDDLDDEKIEDMVKQSIEDAIENNIGAGFDIVWPKGYDGPTAGGAAPPPRP